MKPLTESDTRAKLIDPALHKKGWTEDLIRREETDRGIDIIDGKPRRRERGRIDYLLRVRVNINTQPIAIALIEAKKSSEPPDKGLEQAKKYARLNHVPFVYSSNGHLFVEYDHYTGKTFGPRHLEEFPTPSELRQRYEKGIEVSLESETARPLLVPYPGGEASRRYYQDAAIRAAIEKIARSEKRLLLFLATGSGKTFIAVHVNPAGTYIVTGKEGKLAMVTVEEYKQRVAERLVEEIKTFDDFRNCWINPQERKRLIDSLPNAGRGIRLLQQILNRKEYDLYDVLAEVGFGIAPKSRRERTEALRYKHDVWIKSLPKKAADTLLALARQFERGGTEELENPYVFNAPDVLKVGGLEALKILGEPKDIINETKEKLFSA